MPNPFQSAPCPSTNPRPGRFSTPHRRGVKRLQAALSITALSLLVWGCSVIVISGPDVVRPGERADFVVRIDSANNAVGATVYLAVDIPEDWYFLGSSYVADRLGATETGGGTLIGDPGFLDFPADPVPPGFRRIFLEDSSLEFGIDDFADVQLSFWVDGPPGTYSVTFWTAGNAGPGTQNGGSASKTVTQLAAGDSGDRAGLIQGSLRTDNFFSDEETNQVLADDVVISSPTGRFWLRRLEVLGLYAELPSTALFSVSVYDDNAGLPGGLIQQFTGVQADLVPTGASGNQGLAEQLFHLDLPQPVELPNGTYWIEVEDQTPSFNFGWYSGAADPDNGRPGIAATVDGGAWFPVSIDLAVRLLGSNHEILFQDALGTDTSMQAQLTCGAGAETYVGDSCPWALFAPTAPTVGAWGNSDCTAYATASSRAELTTPVIDVGACPAGTQAILELSYLLDLQELFEFDRAFIEVEIDGQPRVVATSSKGPGPLGGDFCAPRPEYRGGLVDDRRWRRVSIPLGTGSELIVRIAGETFDAIDNSGAGFLIDDLWIRCGPELFVDGFELGELTSWNSVVP